eukprot:805246_1
MEVSHEQPVLRFVSHVEKESDTVIPNETKRNINSTQRRRKRKRCIENSYTDGDIEQAKHMTNILNEQFTITPNAYVSAVCKEFSDLTVPPISFMNGPLQQCASKTD